MHRKIAILPVDHMTKWRRHGYIVHFSGLAIYEDKVDA